MGEQERKAALEAFFVLYKETLEQVFVEANELVMMIGLRGVQFD